MSITRREFAALTGLAFGGCGTHAEMARPGALRGDMGLLDLELLRAGVILRRRTESLVGGLLLWQRQQAIGAACGHSRTPSSHRAAQI